MCKLTAAVFLLQYLIQFNKVIISSLALPSGQQQVLHACVSTLWGPVWGFRPSLWGHFAAGELKTKNCSSDRENTTVVLHTCSIWATALLLLQYRVVYLCSITSTVLLVQTETDESVQWGGGGRNRQREETVRQSRGVSVLKVQSVQQSSVTRLWVFFSTCLCLSACLPVYLSLPVCLHLSLSQSLTMDLYRCGSLIIVFLLQINCFHSVYITGNTGETNWYSNTLLWILSVLLLILFELQ